MLAHEAALAGELDEVQLHCALVRLLLLRLDRSGDAPTPARREALVQVQAIMNAMKAALVAQRQEVLRHMQDLACATEYQDAVQPEHRPASWTGYLV
jgi:hypothetical protein